MIEIPKGTGEPGTWKPYLAHTPEPEFKPYWSAMVRCPICSTRMSLSGHTIDSEGCVSPSIGHPTGVPECSWHPNPGMGKLLGWPEQLRNALPVYGPPEKCARCGHEAHTIGGWGTWNGPGIICDKCHKEVHPKA